MTVSFTLCIVCYLEVSGFHCNASTFIGTLREIWYVISWHWFFTGQHPRVFSVEFWGNWWNTAWYIQDITYWLLSQMSIWKFCSCWSILSVITIIIWMTWRVVYLLMMWVFTLTNYIATMPAYFIRNFQLLSIAII